MRYLICCALFLFLCISALPSFAKTPAFDYADFARLPVLHEGRIKPLESFARLHLRQISGAESAAGMSANAWLAEALFDPSGAAERKNFSVRSDVLKAQLGLDGKDKIFSLTQLQGGLQKTVPQAQALLDAAPEALTDDQRALLQLHENVLTFLQLMRSFSLLLPLDINLPENYKDLVGDTPNYLQLSRIEEKAREDLKALTQHKGDNYEYYTPEEKRLADLTFQLHVFRNAAENNQLLRIIPGTWGAAENEWFSPWALLQQGFGSPGSALYLDQLKSMATAYRNGDTLAWKKASAAALAHIKSRKSLTISPEKMQLEILYGQLKPFHIALALYAFCIALLLAGFFSRNIFLQNASILSLALGALSHSVGIAARIYILSRPPVGTLYESVLFVSLVCVLISLFLTLRSKNNNLSFTMVLGGALIGTALLGIAPLLVESGEDMEMLVAVLNTNLWLTTHVICITIGYGICALAALLAHGYLILRAGRKSPDVLAKIHQLLYRTTLFALLFTAVGTVLGGIWADQSWGRFWGWDPKENGALLIVLWLVWMQHGRQSGHMRALHYAAATASLNIIVALSWFGVNLLSVGLHSYGFTSGAAAALGIFCAAETFVIAALWFMINSRERQAYGA